MNDKGWKQSLWDFFATGVGFWIARDNKTTIEKVIVGMMALLVFAVTVLF